MFRSLAMIAAALLLAHGAAAATPATGGKRGLRFDSPGVLDLADRLLRLDAAPAVPVGELADAGAERIFSAPAFGEDPPLLRFSGDEYGCAKPARRCSLERERALLAAAAKSVARSGATLTITPAAGAPAIFVDWKQATTATADGDAEAHWYLGRMPGNGYHRVEVQFGHDAPGNFLVNAQSGKAAFVHNGADLVAPSPDGMLLVTWNSLNPPLSLRVAALDAAGPRLVAQCQAPDTGTRLTPLFKGWHGTDAFEFVVEIGDQGKSMARLAARLSRHDGKWRLDASDAARREKTGFFCSAAGAFPS